MTREKWMYLMPSLPQFSQVWLIPKPGRVCGGRATPARDEGRVRDHLTTWSCTSLWDQLGCIQELADVIVGPLFVIFKRSWYLGEWTHSALEKGSITPMLEVDEKKGTGNYRLICSLPLGR